MVGPELADQGCGNGLTEARRVDGELSQSTGLEDGEVSVVSCALAAQCRCQRWAVRQEPCGFEHEAFPQLVSPSHAEAAHVGGDEVHARTPFQGLHEVQRPARGAFRMLEEDVATEGDLQLEEVEHEAEMVGGVGQAALELPWSHPELGQVHDVGEVGAHGRPDEQLWPCASKQFLGVLAPRRVIEVPWFPAGVGDQSVQRPASREASSLAVWHHSGRTVDFSHAVQSWRGREECEDRDLIRFDQVDVHVRVLLGGVRDNGKRRRLRLRLRGRLLAARR